MRDKDIGKIVRRLTAVLYPALASRLGEMFDDYRDRKRMEAALKASGEIVTNWPTIFRRFNQPHLLNTLKVLLDCPEYYISNTCSDSVRFKIDADVEEVQKEIFEWLKIRVQQEKEKIYLVSSLGPSQSKALFHAICSTLKRAEEIRDWHRGSNAYVVPYTLDSHWIMEEEKR